MKYQDLTAQMTGRNSTRRKLANNTYAEKRDSDAIAIRLHGTDVLTFSPDGSVTATSGGWKTVTTKARLNEYLPSGFGISQERGLWYWTRHNGSFERLGLFTDGDKIMPNGTLKVQAKPADEKAGLKLRKRVNTFARLCADACPLPRPGAGDCFYCAMVTVKDGQPLGDACKDASHLESHMDEGYVVPSLVFNALKERGYGPLVIQMAFDQTAERKFPFGDMVKRAVAKYVFKRLNATA